MMRRANLSHFRSPHPHRMSRVSNKSSNKPKAKRTQRPSSVPRIAAQANARHIAAKGLAANARSDQAQGETHRARAPPAARLLTKADVCAITGTSFVTIWRWMQRGQFPRARVVGSGATARALWLASEIDEWLASLPVKHLKGDTAA
jgi:predicted DNA-binding transcriptional regulator AlpA